MTDIVARLQYCSKYGAYQQGPPGRLMAEAAAEIERQQADIDKLMSERLGWLDEIERLRAALQSIANYPHGDTAAQLLRGYARMALEPKP